MAKLSVKNKWRQPQQFTGKSGKTHRLGARATAGPFDEKELDTDSYRALRNTGAVVSVPFKAKPKAKSKKGKALKKAAAKNPAPTEKGSSKKTPEKEDK